MNFKFSGNEVIEIAIQIEQKGYTETSYTNAFINRIAIGAIWI